jgi:hypothetical protein
LKKGLVLLLLLCPQLVMAEFQITPYFAKYEVRYNGFKLGELTQQLSPVIDGLQTLQTRAYTTGIASLLKSDMATQFSLWAREKGENLPVRYSYQYSGSRDDRSEKLEFDWSGGKVKSLYKGVDTVLQLESGTFDKHMVQIALRQDLSREVKEFSYPVVDRNRLKQYTFKVLGVESVMTRAFGKLKCLKLKRGTTLFWLAEKLDYLPIKIEKDEEGTAVSTYLIEFKGE